MKIVVFSDIHNAPINATHILNKEKNADIFIFLGDGYSEAKNIIEKSNKKIYCVKGNCDSSSYGLPQEDEIFIAGKKVFFCHGDRYRVKWGLDIIADEGKARSADIILYGHTHIADQSYQNGIYLINPGAASGFNATYGILDVRENGVLFSYVPICGANSIEK